MYGEEDIIQRIYFNLQWGQGGNQPDPGGSVTAQTGDPLFMSICVLLLIFIAIGTMCFMFRKQIVKAGKSIASSTSVIATFPLATKITLAIVSAIAIALCSIVIITGSAYADNKNGDEWNQFTPHIQAKAYLDENTGDLTFDIPQQTLPYDDLGILRNFGVNTYIDSPSLIRAWWDLYIDDYCVYSYYDMPVQGASFNATVNKNFKIKLIAHNVDINEVRPYIGTNFFEFFWHAVDSKYYEGAINKLILPVDISELTIVDQEKFNDFCYQNGWYKNEDIMPNCYLKDFGIESYSMPLSVITNQWDNLINEGILKTNNKVFSRFHLSTNSNGVAPLNTLFQSYNDNYGDFLLGNTVAPLFTNKEMLPVAIVTPNEAPWTAEGLQAAQAEGWTLNEDGLMEKPFPGDTQIHDILRCIPDNWFEQNYLYCMFWSTNYGSVCDFYNNGKYAEESGTVNYWRSEKINGYIIDEDGQSMKNVRVCNDINIFTPSIFSERGIFCAECDITDPSGYFEFYYPKGTGPVVYCDDANLAGVMPDVISDYVLIDDFSTHNLGQVTAFKCAYIKVSQIHSDDIPEVEYQYVTTGKDGKERVFYPDGSDPIKVPANSKGFIVTEDPDYTFKEADKVVTAPDWGKSIEITRTVVPRQATEKPDPDTPAPDTPDDPIEPDPVVPDPESPDTPDDPVVPDPETPASQLPAIKP